MYDVWVSGAYDARQEKPAYGAWMCPALQTYKLTKKAQAVGLNDGLRIGCAMAILSAFDTLGENIIIHIPRYPAPRWVTNPRHGVPLPNLMQRILYKKEIHPRLASNRLHVCVSVNDVYDAQLHALLAKGEVPRECI